MTKLASPAKRVALYEGPETRSHPHRAELFQALLERGIPVSRCATKADLAASGCEIVVTENGVSTLSNDAELVANLDSVQWITTDRMAAAAIVERVESEAKGPEETPSRPWKPWFPVIDHDRCTDCMQCLSFCLFDVYGVNPKTGGIQVHNEENCKTDCPACSRVCPEVAILFPKYSQGPINGDQVRDQDMQREKMKVDISALLGGDVYSSLRERRASTQNRFSKERDDEKALNERQRCLSELKDSMDIPDEVMASLPSLQEIRRKAEEARRKAEEALEQRSDP